MSTQARSNSAGSARITEITPGKLAIPLRTHNPNNSDVLLGLILNPTTGGCGFSLFEVDTDLSF